MAGVSGLRRWLASETTASLMRVPGSALEQCRDLGPDEGEIPVIVDGIAGTMAVKRRNRMQRGRPGIDQKRQLGLVVAPVEIAVRAAGHQQHARRDRRQRATEVAAELTAPADVAAL